MRLDFDNTDHNEEEPDNFFWFKASVCLICLGLVIYDFVESCLIRGVC